MTFPLKPAWSSGMSRWYIHVYMYLYIHVYSHYIRYIPIISPVDYPKIPKNYRSLSIQILVKSAEIIMKINRWNPITYHHAKKSLKKPTKSSLNHHEFTINHNEVLASPKNFSTAKAPRSRMHQGALGSLGSNTSLGKRWALVGLWWENMLEIFGNITFNKYLVKNVYSYLILFDCIWMGSKPTFNEGTTLESPSAGEELLPDDNQWVW